MSLGGDIDYATTVDNAVDQFATGLDQLIKVLADASLSTLDQDAADCGDARPGADAEPDPADRSFA